MVEQDTIRLLRECDAGVRMGIDSIEEVLDSVKSEKLEKYLTDCKEQHKKLQNEICEQLDKFEDEGKAPNPIAKGMSWLKTNFKMSMDESDATVADLITDGCNMGVKSLNRYLNEYKAADEVSKDICKRLINLDDRRELTRIIDEFTAKYQAGGFHRLTHEASPFHSKVIDSLVSLLNVQTASSKESIMDVAKTEQILHSLLSSPCNFTPLLHFIIPSVFGDVRSFAEMWINPQSDENDYPETSHKGKGIHFLMVMDIDGVGRFEVEFFAHESPKSIDLNLYCPKGLETQFTTMVRGLPQLLSNSVYRIGRAKVDTIKEPRSLMDVFKSLPYRRVGVDVTV